MPYQINGQTVSAAAPQPRGGELYVPLADLVEALGGQVSWDNDQKLATATVGQWKATIRMADRNVDVSGTPITLSGDPYVDQDVMWVPANFFRDAFGYQVAADPDSKNVSISLQA